MGYELIPVAIDPAVYDLLEYVRQLEERQAHACYVPPEVFSGTARYSSNETTLRLFCARLGIPFPTRSKEKTDGESTPVQSLQDG